MESRQVRGFGASWLGLQGSPWLSRSRRLQGAAGVPPMIPRPPGPMVSDFALQARAIGPRGSQELPARADSGQPLPAARPPPPPSPGPPAQPGGQWQRAEQSPGGPECGPHARHWAGRAFGDRLLPPASASRESPAQARQLLKGRRAGGHPWACGQACMVLCTAPLPHPPRRGGCGPYTQL